MGIKVDFVRNGREAARVAKFLDGLLGGGLHPKTEFRRWATSFSDGAVVVAKDSRKLVGAACCVVGGPEDWIHTYGALGHPDLRPRFYAGTVGILKSAAVLSLYRGQGIATAMLDLQLEFLAEAGCTTCVTLSWDHGSRELSSLPLFLKRGFMKQGYYRNAWEDQLCPAWLLSKEL